MPRLPALPRAVRIVEVGPRDGLQACPLLKPPRLSAHAPFHN